MSFLKPMTLNILVICSLMTVLAQNPPGSSVSQSTGRLASNVIESIEFRGLTRTPQETVKAIIASKAGDIFDEKAVQRDFSALWKTSRFDDVKVNTEKGARGGIIMRFTLTERT